MGKMPLKWRLHRHAVRLRGPRCATKLGCAAASITVAAPMLNGEPDVRLEVTDREYIIRIRKSAIPHEMIVKMVEVFATQHGIPVPAITEETKR